MGHRHRLRFGRAGARLALGDLREQEEALRKRLGTDDLTDAQEVDVPIDMVAEKNPEMSQYVKDVRAAVNPATVSLIRSRMEKALDWNTISELSERMNQVRLAQATETAAGSVVGAS